MLLGSLATLSSLVICASSGFLWLREAAVAWRTEPTNRYQDLWVWDGDLLLLSCPFFTSVTFNVSFITQRWKYLSHRVRAFFMTLFVSSDRKPNPNWLLTKGHLLVYVGEKSRGRDGFRHLWIQRVNSERKWYHQDSQLCVLLPPSGSGSKSDKMAGSSPRPRVLLLQLQQTSLRTLAEVQLNSRCSNWVMFPSLRWFLWPGELAAWISWGPGDLSYLRCWGVVLAAAHGRGMGGWRFSSEKLGYIVQNGEKMLDRNQHRCPPRLCWRADEII